MTRPRRTPTTRGQLATEAGGTGGAASEEKRPPGVRHVSGLVAGLGVLAAVAVPAFITALLALASVTYSEPAEPAVGTLWAGITVLLLSLPVAAGMLVSRAQSPGRAVRSSRGWLTIGVVATVLMALWRILRRVV